MREEGRDADEPVVNLDFVRLKWQSVVNAVGEINRSLPFILKISQPHSVEGSKIIIRFQYPFHCEKIISEMKHRRVVEECLNKILDTQGITIDGVVGDTLESAESRKQDTVSNILKAFGGNVIEPRI